VRWWAARSPAARCPATGRSPWRPSTAAPGDVFIAWPRAGGGGNFDELGGNRKLAGVVVYGAIRDTRDIVRLGLPVFATHVCAQAGEPKGLGEIGGTLRIQGLDVRPGDWIVGDEDGIVVVPKAKAVDWANRAMYCLEAENRLRSEINGQHSTLAKVMDLEKWEKKVLSGEEGLERLPAKE
jgi:3-hexulose-6-phosphate synthase/6-phospho-3-hexuloisomerase